MSIIKIKFLFIGLLIIVGIFLCFNTDPFSYFSEEETYYGNMDEHQSKMKVYAENDVYEVDKNLIADDVVQGDLFEITFTDAKGVVLDVKKVHQSDIPKDIQKKMNLK
ncbi:hypothetical protein GLV95_09855 [Staphylococcus agnetis]|uniref:hypothetical protein n=1 Tax=Staphylococcus agnetis TaxID=985762 RepID=UPI00142F4A33|nr:hypothetical protein [Staphylococcus agnetis]NJI16284.1 hypothetical protein [Staphylococcus agnetis]